MNPEPLYFDDLRVGDTYTSGTYELSADDIRRFAGEFDPQPFHLDDGAARQSPFGGLAASGWHTAAITMRLLVTSELKLASGFLGAGGEVAWHLPTRPGDALHLESEVLELTASRSRQDRGLLVLRTKTLNQRGEVVQTLTAKLMVSRRVIQAAA